MSSDTITLTVTPRQILGKSVAGLRRTGQVPAVVHNHGQQSWPVQAAYLPLLKVYEQAGKHHPVELSVDGQSHLVLIKEASFAPTRQRLEHVVFQAIRRNEAVEAEVPVTFDEVEIPAEKISLMVLKQLDHVAVKALPKDLPDELKVDPSSLKDVGDNLTVADLKVPAGVVVITDPTAQIAVVEMPKDQIAEAEAAAADLAADAAKTETEQPGEAEASAAPEAEGDEQTPKTEP